ncbi:ABC transporter ATP-binding protein [Geminocystis sp. GBBB08]|uniref:energy-coupling factor ABC transporter ATP-binding protein n=1 Tax=Geminocystis sp. GBBB08 TaxID=2604140 RepID=UPI0027E312B7|nr:ABC transporter ATP-binding protein [Geminocystis sp. GBBB08]MBL1209943.1 ABC transporter ATP-binding protein [Geminocystis sp. GBBB08]
MIIEFEKIFYTYACSQKPTIENLSLQLHGGKRYGLIGNNGSGKTTFLRLANGLYRPHHGLIRISGKPLNYDRQSLKEWYQQVGLVFQDPEQQLVATTVEEDLSYGLCNLGIPNIEIEQRVAITLKDFNLTELAHFPVNYLSLGQKKRLAIADVMILKPKILLLDEPTAYLDPKQRKELIKQLEQIFKEGTTILLATHDLDFIYRWADWIFVMDRGKIALEGTPKQVFEQKILLEQLDLDIPLELKLRTSIIDN